jgi:glycosyltransferase involved in cell wall biosynthesis
MKKISVVTICYNEEGIIREYYEEVVKALAVLVNPYTFEIIIADNASTDQTPQILRDIAAQDKNFKVIFNARNFGVNRSGNNAFIQATGDAAILMVSDLQDPPSLIPEFIEKWEQGYKVVMAVKNQSKESPLIYFLRSLYYVTLEKMSEVKPIQHFTGFGLYDKQILDIYKNLDDPRPYFRGLISDIGLAIDLVVGGRGVRRQQRRRRHELPRLAVAALRDAERDPGELQRVCAVG